MTPTNPPKRKTFVTAQPLATKSRSKSKSFVTAQPLAAPKAVQPLAAPKAAQPLATKSASFVTVQPLAAPKAVQPLAALLLLAFLLLQSCRTVRQTTAADAERQATAERLATVSTAQQTEQTASLVDFAADAITIYYDTTAESSPRIRAPTNNHRPCAIRIDKPRLTQRSLQRTEASTNIKSNKQTTDNRIRDQTRTATSDTTKVASPANGANLLVIAILTIAIVTYIYIKKK